VVPHLSFTIANTNNPYTSISYGELKRFGQVFSFALIAFWCSWILLRCDLGTGVSCETCSSVEPIAVWKPTVVWNSLFLETACCQFHQAVRDSVWLNRGGSVKLLGRIVGSCPEVRSAATPDPRFSADDLHTDQWMATTVCMHSTLNPEVPCIFRQVTWCTEKTNWQKLE